MLDARTNYKEALDEFMTCFICNSRFNTVTRRPLALFCGHTFCSSCVPHFKQVFGQLNCPIDHINEVRPAATIPCNENLLSIIRTMEIKCAFHPDTPADYYTDQSVEPICDECQPFFTAQRCVEMKDLTFPDFLIEQIDKARATVGGTLGRYPALGTQLENVRGLLNNEKQKLLFGLQNVAKGLDPSTPRQRPEQKKATPTAPTHFTLFDNGIYEISRFRRIVPNPAQATEEAKQWWISNKGTQVDALVVSASVPINLLGIGMGREVVNSPSAKIDYMDVLMGVSTQAPQRFRTFVNTPYSGQDPQVMTLWFPQSIAMRANEKITIKVKPTGRGLYYGDPSARIEPLTGPGDMLFYFDDPAYEGGDFQNGQSKWAGPIVKLYFSFQTR